MYVCMHVCMYLCKHIYIYVHIHIYIYIQMYIYIYACNISSLHFLYGCLFPKSYGKFRNLTHPWERGSRVFRGLSIGAVLRWCSPICEKKHMTYILSSWGYKKNHWLSCGASKDDAFFFAASKNRQESRVRSSFRGFTIEYDNIHVIPRSYEQHQMVPTVDVELPDRFFKPWFRTFRGCFFVWTDGMGLQILKMGDPKYWMVGIQSHTHS